MSIHMNRLMILAGNNTNKSIHGVLKSMAEDFVVDEVPLYTPLGEGEHLYLTVQKTNCSHDELIRQIARYFGIQPRDIGCAGRKDFTAKTTQQLSLYLPGQSMSVPDSIDQINILSYSRHSNKLRLGHLKGNQFKIRLREIESQFYPCIQQRLERLAAHGLPNAFGPQRFGNRGDNADIGRLWLLCDWDSLANCLLQGGEAHNQLAMDGEYQQAMDAWPFGQPAQRNILEQFVKGKDAKQACNKIPRALLKLCVNAFQSMIFNEVLSKRITDGTWNKLLVGDLAWKHEGGGRTFEVSDEDAQSLNIKNRIDSFEISPTGPLWGEKMRLPSRDVLKIEQSELRRYNIGPEHLQRMKKQALGARRPLRVPVKQISMKKHKDFVELSFILPAGSYATVVVDYLLNGEV